MEIEEVVGFWLHHESIFWTTNLCGFFMGCEKKEEAKIRLWLGHKNDWKNGIAIIRDGDAKSRAGLVAGWLQLWT